MISIAVLLTCHNRKAKTLGCLTALFAQKLLDVTLKVYLVDDGCTDGTAVAVAAAFSQVTLIKGDGQLYWNGGMRKCWQYAQQQHQSDFYLLLNDDVELCHDAIQRLVACFYATSNAGAVIGTMRDRKTSVASYGGRNVRFWLHPMWTTEVLVPKDVPIPCDYINGNLCLIPANAVNKIGILSDRFTHSMGDFDYGVRLRRAGFSLFVAPGFYGFCDRNPLRGSIRDPSIPIEQRLRLMCRPNVCPPLTEWRWFIRQHGGAVWPFLYIKATIGRLFPKLWLWFNQKSTKTPKS
jgi:GT2 family glycosyltransferase